MNKQTQIFFRLTAVRIIITNTDVIIFITNVIKVKVISSNVIILPSIRG